MVTMPFRGGSQSLTEHLDSTYHQLKPTTVDGKPGQFESYLSSFPEVMSVALWRFQSVMDCNRMRQVKVNGRFEFPLEIDMAPHGPENHPPEIYRLYA